MSEPLDNLCLRPGLGKAGLPSQVFTNYFPIIYDKPATIHHYAVTILPDVPSGVNKHIFAMFQQQYQKENKVLGSIFLVYDGAKNAFAPRLLPFGTQFTAEIVLPERGRVSKNGQSSRIFTLKMSMVNEIKVDIQDMYQRNTKGLTALMAFNILFLHLPSNDFIQIKESLFTNEGAQCISGGLEIWPGFFRSVLACTDGLMLNVDTTVCVFYRSGSLLDLLVAFIGLRGREELRDPRFKHHVKHIQKFLNNVKIELLHCGEVSRAYKILGLTPKGADETKFLFVEDGVERETMSVATYFSQKLGINLEFPMLPCVEIKKGVAIPMELCNVVSGRRYPRKLDELQTADMIRFTCTKPTIRAEKILKGIRVMDYAKSEGLAQFGLQLVPTLKTVSSRLLSPPAVLYHPTSRKKIIRPNDGAWSLNEVRMFDAKELHNWAVIVFAAENAVRRPAVESFVKLQISIAHEKGLSVSPTPDIFYASPNPATLEKSLNDIFVTVSNKKRAKPQLFMCILKERSNPLYGGIKSICELKLGLPTQCLMANKIIPAKPQYCANVVLKLNAKLGGINSSVNPEELGQLKASSTILIGADVSHPSPGSHYGSVAAAVGSTDYTACRYSSSTRLQNSRVEIIEDLQAMIVELLKGFYRTVKDKPKQIIYFRDGVSEGQFSQVLLHEMGAIKKACASLEQGYCPKVTFVVVQKRHHTRFFPKLADADRSGNCKAGTVVDTGICHPFYFDFFLQPHGGLQGTSRPAHYHVLVDEIRFTVDSLQSLCNNLSYLFNRATRAVSIVPPVYYAHLAADRARHHFQVIEGAESSSNSTCNEARTIHQSMTNCMYYV
ncbi:hypothetical protein DSO57_1034311 [Entomophthora muscae]|uniref:Uncharacterized protein n=1 Tax=Entomophthora muscae TaxID=34485 RepID=A0ACC2TYH2_9FUNG|nr:hypothetical protein DSO57_1034311 [Entomophthora muscae]